MVITLNLPLPFRVNAINIPFIIVMNSAKKLNYRKAIWAQEAFESEYRTKKPMSFFKYALRDSKTICEVELLGHEVEVQTIKLFYPHLNENSCRISEADVMYNSYYDAFKKEGYTPETIIQSMMTVSTVASEWVEKNYSKISKQ